MESHCRPHRCLPSDGSSPLRVVLWLGWVLASAAETCLPFAVPAARRGALIKDPLGAAVRVPLRIFDLGWPSSSVTSNVFQILVMEVLGMNATIDISGDSSLAGLYAAAGCTRPSQDGNRGCPTRFSDDPDHAVLLEVWLLAGRLKLVNDDVPGFEAEDLGSIGYIGTDGFGGRGSTLSETYQRTGLALEYYRSYNVSWSQPWLFFSNLTDLDSTRLMPCNETRMHDGYVADSLLRFTNDTGGVVRDSEGQFILRCWDGVWWRAPACREAPETCIPLITGGNGWAFETMAMQMVAHSLPVAIGVGATFNDYVSLAFSANILFYRWDPDTTFVELSPFYVQFPPHDPDAYAELDRRTNTPSNPLKKVVTPGLASESPIIYQLVRNMHMSRKDLDQLLLAYKQKGEGRTSHDVACDWIKSNEKVWRPWIPDATSCIPRMGLVDGSRLPVLNRIDATSCDWCAAGTYSEPMEDDEGATYVCHQCSGGQHQELPGQLSCENCGRGTHAEMEGTVHCIECRPGNYSERDGQLHCQVCPPGSVSSQEGATECLLCSVGTSQPHTGRTACARCETGKFQSGHGAHNCDSCDDVLRGSTSAVGAVNPGECMCEIGFFRKQKKLGPECEKCSEHRGLECPGGIGEPLQVAGHWVEVIDRDAGEYSVFLCRSALQCPRGFLGTCASGRQGKACNSCMTAHYPVSSGMCLPCTSESAVPLMCVFFLGPPVLVVATLALLRVDASTQHLSTLTVVATAGQLFTAMQVLGSLHQLQVSLVNPAQFMLSVAGLLAFDLDFLRVPCLFHRDDPIVPFALKLAILPCLTGILGVAWLTGKIVKRPIESHAVFNAIGLFNAVFFISITLAVLLPLQCRPNPNGRLSVLTEPGIECFNSDVHWVMVALALFGVLAFPVAILAWAVQATLRFPALARTEKGVQMLRSQRFFFSRFKTERHYFAMVLFIRNTLVALVPVLLVSTPAIQCSAVALVLLVVFAIQATLLPWRTRPSNSSALLLDGLLITAVVSVAPTISSGTGVSQRAISWYISLCASGMLGAALCFLIFNIYKRLRQVRQYGAFLCHHKAGAGVLARQIKMLLQARCRSTIFLDCDELDDLQGLFDIVRSDTSNFVLLLSGNVLSRCWCAGEIATAHRNKIRTVVLVLDSCELPSEAQIEAITSAWTLEEQRTLLAFDITTSMVAAAYAHLVTAAQVRCSRSTGTRHKGAVVQELMCHCKLSSWRFTTTAAESVGEGSEAPVLVLGAVENMEVLASCEVLQMMLQETLQLPVRVARSAKGAASGIYSSLVVVLTEGLLGDAAFAETFLACCRADAQHTAQMVPVLADNLFQFPTADTYARLEDVGVPPLGKEVGAPLVDAYLDLFATIALPFSPLASEAVLKLEVSELCRRRLRNPSSGSPRGTPRAQTSVQLGRTKDVEASLEGRPSAREILFEEESSEYSDTLSI